MPTYEMKPMQSGTRMRADHSTYTTVLLSDLSPADTLRGNELWIAPADGSYVKKGDTWLKVTHRNGVALAKPGWTAYLYLGKFVCNNFKEIADVPPPVDPPLETIFPESFILTDPKTGNKAEYHFVRFVE